MKLVGSKGAVRSAEFHRKKERERKFYSALYILLIIAVLVGPIFVFRSKKFVISDILVRGNSVTQTKEIEDLVRTKLSGYYLKLIPRGSSLFYPEDDIVKTLDTSIPRLASVNVSLDGLKVMNVDVTEREPSALYCDSLSESESCYFLDNAGYIYSEAPEFTDGVYLVYESEPAIESPVDKFVLETKEFERLGKFVDSLNKFGMTPNKILYKDGDFFLSLLSGTEVRWSQSQDFEKVLIDLESFIKGSKFKSGELESLLYLDLRFDNKVYYKPRE